MDYYSGQRCDSVIAVSDHVENRLSSLYNISGENIEQITPGLDTNVFYPRNKTSELTNSDRFTLLFVGRIEQIKGLDLLLKTLSSFDTNDIELVIAGEGSDTKRLASLSEEFGISDITYFVGRVPHEQLPVLYSDSDLLVLPSEYESLSFVVREAMACGLPALCSDVGGISTSVSHEENGFLVERTSDSFQKVIKHLIENPERLNQLGENAETAAREWSWDANAHKTELLYREIVDI